MPLGPARPPVAAGPGGGAAPTRPWRVPPEYFSQEEGQGLIGRAGQAASVCAARTASNAHSIQGISAATSEVSTVEPHQILRPAGASR